MAPISLFLPNGCKGRLKDFERIRNDGPYYRPIQSSQSQYRPQLAAPAAQTSNGGGSSSSSSSSDEGILATLSNGFNSLVNNIFG